VFFLYKNYTTNTNIITTNIQQTYNKITTKLQHLTTPHILAPFYTTNIQQVTTKFFWGIHLRRKKNKKNGEKVPILRDFLV